MSGIFGTESRGTSSFVLATLSGATLAAAGGAVVSQNFSMDELRRVFIRVNGYLNPTAAIKLRVTLFSASSPQSTAQIPNVSAELILPPTGASPTSRFADFIFLNSDIVWNGQVMPHSAHEFTLYNNTNLALQDPNGVSVNVNNCFYRSVEVAGRLVGKFRVLLQNWDATNSFTYNSVNIVAVK